MPLSTIINTTQSPPSRRESIELHRLEDNLHNMSEFESTPLVDSSGETKDDSALRGLKFKLGLSFFLFGLTNNVLYVIILSAALDLVPASTPKGIIAFCNIAPALVAKVGWPYILKGKIRYTKRLIGCCLLSMLGMIVVASFSTLEARLLGISLASFSSGLGELTFLQLSTTYHPPSVGGHSVGYFASGTGAAGLVGAFAWWELRYLGVRTGVGLSSVLPLIIPLTYFFLLPRPHAFANAYFEEPEQDSGYAPLATQDATVMDAEEEGTRPILERPDKLYDITLSVQDKWSLVKPLLMKYMLPLFCVYTFEYTINQGIAPTLIYPVPSEGNPIMHLIIHSIRDYYALWQLVYQSTVFLSRSSISLGLPPLPVRLLPLPAILQFCILSALALESGLGIVPPDMEGTAFGICFLLISIEGICGGLAYVNVFYRINQDHKYHPSSGDIVDPVRAERLKQEREFQIGSIGFADSLGILLASLLAMPTEIGLCRAQVSRGKTLCSEL